MPSREFVPAVVFLSLSLAGCSSPAQLQAPPPPTVEIAVVAAQDAGIFVEFPAQTYARDLVEVQQAEGTLRQAEADLSFPLQQVSLLQAEANLEAARANLIKAQQDYSRFKPLVEQDAAARQDLDAATAALHAAEATVQAN